MEHQKLEHAKIALPAPLPDIPDVQKIVKSTYHFDFIQLPEAYTERELECALINQIG